VSRRASPAPPASPFHLRPTSEVLVGSGSLLVAPRSMLPQHRPLAWCPPRLHLPFSVIWPLTSDLCPLVAVVAPSASPPKSSSPGQSGSDRGQRRQADPYRAIHCSPDRHSSCPDPYFPRVLRGARTIAAGKAMGAMQVGHLGARSSVQPSAIWPVSAPQASRFILRLCCPPTSDHLIPPFISRFPSFPFQHLAFPCPLSPLPKIMSKALKTAAKVKQVAGGVQLTIFVKIV
jgi:hypothetical protein